MKKRMSILLLAMAGLASSAFAGLMVHEPFDVESVSALTDGPADGIGWQADSVWTVTNTLGELQLSLAENLEMGRLVTTGAALRITNPNQTTGKLRRGIAITPPARNASVWASYLLHYSGPTNSGTYQKQGFDWSFRNAEKDTYTFASTFLFAGDWDKDMNMGADANGKDMTRIAWPTAPVDGTLYLVVTSITNLSLGSWNGDKRTALRQWVLETDDFNAIVESGLLADTTPEADFSQLLDAHCVGVIEESVDGSWGTGNLGADDVWQFSLELRNYGNPTAVYVLDELRLGASFTDVLPLIPPPPSGTVMLVL